ncbi:GLPGLI family protein [Gelidibacter maritimus]|uniref:GLPGLI family protein n=1 Tax=Gelidibacter maritimus TaxID=2761487 RepID=A0A7W2M301_9FLAO|nr:GLPGLI family protein [Gelidibacter maritimus]MBA6151748.1 GLPGLI family protein [Gelidibacter maritimus]
MKPFILSLVLLSVVQTSVFAQDEYATDYKVHYELAFHIDSLNLDQKDTSNLYLFTNPEFGIFLNQSRVDADVRLEKIRQRLGADVQVKISTNSNKSQDLNKVVFTNHQNGEVRVLQNLGDIDYIYFEPTKMDAWEISEETKEFMGYSVQKATIDFAGRSYEAWFTMEIPIPNGPYVFHGLPGLIVEIYDTQNHYHFTMLGLEKLETPKVWKFPKAEEATKEKVNEIQKRLNDNALNGSDYQYMMGKTPGVSGSISVSDGQEPIMELKNKSGQEITKEDLKRMFKSNLENKNNPIELE